jgi:hypothetical protein
MAHYGLKRRMKKSALERIRRQRRKTDSSYWRYEGMPEPGAVLDRDARARYLSGLGVGGMRKHAAGLQIKGCWTMKKPDLLDAIISAEGYDS